MKKPLPYEIHQHLLQNRGTSQSEHREDPPAGKEYRRMPRIALPEGEIDTSLSHALRGRSSQRELSIAPLTPKTIGTLLGNALGTRGHFRHYPSGGALYPIETYVILKHTEEIARGVYHYEPKSHALEYLWETPKDLDLFIPAMAWANNAPMLILFTGIWERNYVKYGDFGYLLGILEAGHMAENILLSCSALGLAACPLGGFRPDAVSEVLDLDPEQEQPVYVIALGHAPEKP